MKKSEDRIAVTLKYDGVNAPMVTAKGRNDLADEIIALAKEHGIPIEENKALVTFLSQLELNEEIPDMLYRIVAEIIAYAYIIQGKVPQSYYAKGEHTEQRTRPR